MIHSLSTLATLATVRRVVRFEPKGVAWTYLLSSPVGLIKIGHSFNPVQRVAELSKTSPVSLAVVALVPEQIPHSRRHIPTLERTLHGELAERRRHGEWFQFSPDEARAYLSENRCLFRCAYLVESDGGVRRLRRNTLDLLHQAA